MDGRHDRLRLTLKERYRLRQMERGRTRQIPYTTIGTNVLILIALLIVAVWLVIHMGVVAGVAAALLLLNLVLRPRG